jgi:Holliday junction DNA helicase RuvA
VDLREKMTMLSATQVEDQSGVQSQTAPLGSEDSVRADALSALINLGYQRSGAEKAIDAALGEGGEITVESILRRSLKKLARV